MSAGPSSSSPDPSSLAVDVQSATSGSKRPRLEARTEVEVPKDFEVHRYADPEWAKLDTAEKFELLLQQPRGLWVPDGVDAAQDRLQALEEQEEKEKGLEDEEVDDRLWVGAYQQGWRVYIKGKRNDGHYWYITPEGRRLGSKTEAMALGMPRPKSERRAPRGEHDWSRPGDGPDYRPS
tara:strand:+ start:379 stop:915 length:537 start_codon:yes stop_codon:yes gene_type:complete